MHLGFILNKPCVFGPVTSLLLASALPSGTASVPVIPAPGVLSEAVDACRSSLLGDQGWGVLLGQGLAGPVVMTAP